MVCFASLNGTIHRKKCYRRISAVDPDRSPRTNEGVPVLIFNSDSIIYGIWIKSSSAFLKIGFSNIPPAVRSALSKTVDYFA